MSKIGPRGFHQHERPGRVVSRLLGAWVPGPVLSVVFLMFAAGLVVGASHFDPAGLRSFRRRHPEGRNLLVCLDPLDPWTQAYGDLAVEVVPFGHFPAALGAPLPPTA